jgi:dihydropteroate synthase
MAALIASNPAVQYIVMHWRGESKDNMQSRASIKIRGSRYGRKSRGVGPVLSRRSGVNPRANHLFDPGLGLQRVVNIIKTSAT